MNATIQKNQYSQNKIKLHGVKKINATYTTIMFYNNYIADFTIIL